MGKVLGFVLAVVLAVAAFAQDTTPARRALTEWVGKCVSVTDGDTIGVMHDGKEEKLRLNGIDCPEMGQPFGAKAKQFASKLCFGQEVTVKPKEKDKYGRTVADVVLSDGKVLNHELVKFGYAWWYREYAPKDDVLKKMEADAKQAEVALWSDEKAVAPWEWRHNPSGEKTVSDLPPATENKTPPPAENKTTFGDRKGPGAPHKIADRQRPPVAENGSYYGEISANTGRPKTVYVRGYFRKDGTYVRSHYRSLPGRGTSVRGPPRGPGVAENESYYGEISAETGRPKTVYVRGYYRKDGMYVRGHYRSRPMKK